jgi:hypothetical protein
MKKLLPFVFCLAVTFCSACTEAKRFLDDKPDAKASPRANESGRALKSSPSPSASQSPTAANTTAAVFSGDIAGKTGKRLLYQLLEKNNQKPVKLDLLLSDEQLEQLNDVDKGKRWYFDLAYPGDDGYNTGGELLIDLGKGKGDLKLNGNHLTGSIIVTKWAGPHQGLMSINARPVGSEPSNVSKPAASAPSETKAPKKSSNDVP